MFLQIENLGKTFRDEDGTQNEVLRDITLSLSAGEIGVLLGPSGCGKTTLLRIIAGLEEPDNGRLLLHGQNLTTIPVHQRGFGFVFQDYALFPHKNVFDNVAFGLRMQQWPRERMEKRVAQVLELVGLAAYGGRDIQSLSGGEQQRVAVARALAPAPQLLLLDEPLGALDRALRERLMLDLQEILKSAGELLDRPEGITAIYVTHDQAEAFALGDRIVVMKAGRIAQIAPPSELYNRPKTSFVARFLGMDNILPFSRNVTADTVDTPLGSLQLAGNKMIPPEGKLLVRPEAAQLVTHGAEINVFTGKLTARSFRGRYQVVEAVFPAAGGEVMLSLELETAVPLPPVGDSVTIQLDPDLLQLLEGG